jgi:Zn-dependent M28 family amino/carboxypeptidase
LRVASRGALKRLAVLFTAIAAGLLWAWLAMVHMPGTSHVGPLPPITDSQAAASQRLRADVETLAGRIGQRSTFHPRELAGAALFLRESLATIGYAVRDHSFVARGSPAPNMDTEVLGTDRPNQIVLVGAHYDSYQGTPGADDNASGVAAVLELARRFKNVRQSRTIRLALFVNEEPPTFQTPDMGSWVYAKKCRAQGENIIAMISLESLGCYSSEPGSQELPWPLGRFYPDRGDFIAFVGDTGSRSLVKRCIGTFRAGVPFPCQGGAPPGSIPGVGWSDHWAFWQEGYRAIMITDTAGFRNHRYHQPEDRPETLDYESMARVVDGIEAVVLELANGP